MPQLHFQRLLLGLGILLLTAANSQAAIVVLRDFALGEAGSFVGNLPQDSANGVHFANGAAFVQPLTTGVTAPGSTAYAENGRAFNSNAGTAPSVPTDNFGFELWVRSDNTTATSHLFSTGGGGTNSLRLVLDNGNFEATYGDTIGTGGTGTVFASAAATNAWTHLAIIRDSGVSTFYVDGVAQTGTEASAPVHNSFHLGIRPGGGFTFDGGFDELRVFSFDPAVDDPVAFLNVIPEPMSFTLLVGLFSVLMMGRRKRQIAG